MNLKSMLSGLFPAAPATAPRVPSAFVVYAIGDIHGRLDLFDALMDRIWVDAAKSAERRPVIILLGDYIDRGPASAGVLDRLARLRLRTDIDLHLLKGNHEDALQRFLANPDDGPGWLAFGGGATLASYGVAPPRLRSEQMAWRRTRDNLLAALPTDHLALLNSLDLSFTLGDYFFVHAGVRPGIPLEAQDPYDLLWIRDEFLSSQADWPKVVVHGHTPVDTTTLHARRIAIDTGAYATGVLTALRLMDDQQDILQDLANEDRFGSGAQGWIGGAKS